MHTKKIFVTRKFPGEGLELLKKHPHFHVEIFEKDRHITRSELLKRVKGSHGIITMLTDKVDKAFVNAAGSNLKIIANYAVGYDNFDLAELKKRNIAATNTPAILTGAVAEHTVALMFALAKRIVQSDTFVRKGKYKGWEPELLLGTELSGKSVGIIGLGKIGLGVAERCKAMGMKLFYTDTAPNQAFEIHYNATFMPKEELLRNSDFITLHVPLLPQTRHLIGAKELKIMKQTAFLINTARGPVVDERALISALEKKQIQGAALDVFEFEPKISLKLRKLQNVILTPHTASATVDTRSAMGRLAAENIIAGLTGAPLVSPIPMK